MKDKANRRILLQPRLEIVTLNLLVLLCHSTLAFGQTPSNTYYFAHLALGAGWQTTITLINYSPQTVTCATEFFSDSGASLVVPFSTGATASRSDTLGPGGSIHIESTADLNAAVIGGWGRTQCDQAIKSSLLFRRYQGGIAVGEAGVNAVTTPTTKFVNFAEQLTGVAYANPSVGPADITFTALHSAGETLASKSLTRPPSGHGAANLGPLLGLSSFAGSVQIVSSAPIVSLALNFEANPVFSSLPPGDLDPSTPLSTDSSSTGGGGLPPFAQIHIQGTFNTGTRQVPCGIDIVGLGTLGPPVGATLACQSSDLLYDITTGFLTGTASGFTLGFSNIINAGPGGYIDASAGILKGTITDGNMSLIFAGSTVQSTVSGTLKIVVNNSLVVQGSINGAMTSIQ
jgi:hypothetical protein